MNRKTLIALALSGALAAGFVHAQAATGPGPAGSTLPTPLETLIAELELSDGQRAELRALLERQRAERSLRRDATRAERIAEREARRARHRAELAAILTPDQVAAVVAVRDAMRGSHGRGKSRGGGRCEGPRGGAGRPG